MRRLLGVGVVLIAALAAVPAHAAPAPLEYQGNGDIGGFRNILPAGQGSNASALEIAAFQANGAQPLHDHDQFDMYADLVYNAPITAEQIPSFYKDASFGTTPGERERTYSPRADVTIVRDEFGVPHIYGEGRDGAMFGAGYVSAEDRLFFMDVLRNAGRGQLSSFIGGGQTGMDRSVWADTPYTEDELQLQFELGDELYGAQGAELQSDATQYVAGVNKFISEAKADATKMPGEYALINQPVGPSEWKVTDVISTASLVAGIFGKGGGNEIGSALVLDQAKQKFGKKGKRVWKDFRSAEDPEAPTTVHKKKFPYEKVPKKTPGVALPDRGTLEREPLIVEAGGAGGPVDPAQARTGLTTEEPDTSESILGPLEGITGASNALMVSRRESESGNPLAVFGPQVSYFAPQILMEQSMHAPGGPQGDPIDARGVSFLGTNLYVQLGRGRDYSWSATSAGQDIIDTFAVPLCEPTGGKPTLDSQSYLYRGKCEPFEVLERENSWAPTAADMTSSGSETLRALRTKLGVVTHRAEIDGKPYAYTRLRATYFHEVDSAIGFSGFNNPEQMKTTEGFMEAACDIDLTFNWFYINKDEIAYFNSGYNPKRSKKVDPNFPAFGTKKYEWRGYIPPSDSVLEAAPVDPATVDPMSATSKQEPCAKRPQVTDQEYLTSWNNKQARAYRASDSEFGYQSIYRSDPLDERIEAEIAGSGKMNIVELINAMEDAGTVDLRGDAVLPWVLKVIGGGKGASAEAKGAISTLKAWAKSGAHRRDLNRDGTYDDAEAVRIMDAWWPLLLEAEFEPTLGKDLYGVIEDARGIDDTPHKSGTNQGSAYNGGWYGYVQKDLRTLLGKKVRGRYSRVYCGKGKLDACRGDLIDSLEQAVATPESEVYADADSCDLGSAQMCFDAVEFTTTGGVGQPPFHWINRPTFQQVVEPGAAP
ncbi:MAG: penicillin acylase family protein [Solirubrobacterales bacterium]